MYDSSHPSRTATTVKLRSHVKPFGSDRSVKLPGKPSRHGLPAACVKIETRPHPWGCGRVIESGVTSPSGGVKENGQIDQSNAADTLGVTTGSSWRFVTMRTRDSVR